MDTPKSHNSREIQYTVLISLIVVGIGIGLYFAFHRTAKAPVTSTNKKVSIAATTPESYSMISGKIIAIDADKKSIAIDFPIVREQGQGVVKHYTVLVGEKTSVQSVKLATTPPTVETITLNNLAIGDTVDALSENNIAATESFTATSIIRSQP